MPRQLTDSACVWMRAGVIRFWLCDRNFDCDNCPLYAALKGARPAARTFPTALPRSATTGRLQTSSERPSEAASETASGSSRRSDSC